MNKMVNSLRCLSSAPVVRILLALALVSTAVAACYLQDPLGTQDTRIVGAVPGDRINDSVRLYSAESFAYQTMLPVRVKLAFIDADSRPVEGVVATLSTAGGARVLRGLSGEDGTVETGVVLPARHEDITLLVERPGYDTRQVTIREMVRFQSVDRTMALRAQPGSAGTASLGIDTSIEPFGSRTPAEGAITVAFEDLYPRFEPNPDPAARDKFFDADFNDFVARYWVEETHDQAGRLLRLHGEATAVARLAGYTHRFGLLFRFEEYTGSALLSVTRNGSTVRSAASGFADIMLFENSRDDLGKSASFTLTFKPPVQREMVTRAPFDPYIYVDNTSEYIHGIGRSPHPYAEPSEADGWNYQHPQNGMPWTLLIPIDDWQWPGEMVFIEETYPAFRYWRESFGAHYADWYEFFEQDPVPPPVVAIDPEPSEDDPVVQTAESDSAEYTLQLDGNTASTGVWFRAIEMPAPAQFNISLDEQTGIVTVGTTGIGLVPNELRSATVEFYSSFNADSADDPDGGSTIDRPLAVTFYVKGPPPGE